jgi:hypothetical protein
MRTLLLALCVLLVGCASGRGPAGAGKPKAGHGALGGPTLADVPPLANLPVPPPAEIQFFEMTSKDLTAMVYQHAHYRPPQDYSILAVYVGSERAMYVMEGSEEYTDYGTKTVFLGGAVLLIAPTRITL